MGVGVYRRPGEVGKRDMFSVVVICIMDFFWGGGLIFLIKLL